MKEDGAIGLFRGAGPTVVRAMALNMGMLASNDEVSLTMYSSSGRLCIQSMTCRWAGDGLGTGIILLLHDATGGPPAGGLQGSGMYCVSASMRSLHEKKACCPLVVRKHFARDSCCCCPHNLYRMLSEANALVDHP